MRYIIPYISIFLAFFMLSFPVASAAVERLDANLPITLKNAFYGRHKTPNTCIESIELYLKDKQGIDITSGPISTLSEGVTAKYAVPIQLLAFCYAQVEEYQQTYQLLNKLLKQQDFSIEQLRSLELLASEVPEEKRPEYNNQRLIKILTSSLHKIENSPFAKQPNLEVRLLLIITKLHLQIDQYNDANITLSLAKRMLKSNPNDKLDGWLSYYSGIYYVKINQQQLAVANLFFANKVAQRQELIQLSGEVKRTIAELYQAKHLFKRAIDFASQRVELYVKTENRIKQADSLIKLAILKENNNEKNESLIYLFNALELIQDKKHSSLLAQIYLELGRTYSRYVTKSQTNYEINKKNQKERLLAQKYLQNARYHFTRLKEVRYQIESLLLLAQLNLINDDPALAILQLEKTLKLAPNEHPKLRARAFDMLASSYELTGNHQQAITYFKNFHALQNRIKAHSLALQQLRINEQLQLIERTQQKQQLELENSVLKNTNAQFETLTYGTIFLLIVIIFCLFKILVRYRKLVFSESRSQHQLNYHPRTHLASQQVQRNDFEYVYYGEPLYYALVSLPFLTLLNTSSGLFSGAKKEAELGKALLKHFQDSADIFQIRDNQILFISEQKKHENAQCFAQKIELFFTQFIAKNQLTSGISIGIVAFPFLNNVSRAITPIRMLNLSSLALFGANQLLDKYQQNSWLELYAIDNLQPAFFDGDLWVLGQKAIQKGIVKVNSSHPNHTFYWPEMDK